MKPTLIILLSLFPLFLSGQIISADSALALMKNWYQYKYDNIDSAVFEEIPDFNSKRFILKDNCLLSEDGKRFYTSKIPWSYSYDFYGDTIKVPDGVEVVDFVLSFYEHYQLYIPGSVKKIAYLPFNIVSSIVAPENSVYQSINNCLVTKDGKTLLIFGKKHTKHNNYNIIVPEGVEEIDLSAYGYHNYSYPSPDTLLLPKSLKNIDKIFGDTVIVQSDALMVKNNCILSKDGKRLLRGGLTGDDIIIPEGVEIYCPYLMPGTCKQLFLPSTLAQVKDFNHYYETLIISPENKYFQAKNNCLLSKNGDTLLAISWENKKVSIPEGVKSSKNFNYYSIYNSDTEVLEIPSSLISDETPKAKSYICAKGNKMYSTKDGNLLSANGKTLIQFNTTNRNHLTVPEGVESIIDDQYRYYYEPDTFNLPSSFKQISMKAVLDLIVDEKVNIIIHPDNKNMWYSNNMFVSGGGTKLLFCGQYPDINIPNGIDSLFSKVFYYDKFGDGGKLTIPESVCYIDSGFFRDHSYIVKFDVSPQSPFFKRIGNSLVTSQGELILLERSGISTSEGVIIPDGVKKISSQSWILYNFTNDDDDLCCCERDEECHPFVPLMVDWDVYEHKIYIPPSVESISPALFYDYWKSEPIKIKLSRKNQHFTLRHGILRTTTGEIIYNPHDRFLYKNGEDYEPELVRVKD
ncbi:MAG: hypothetical protein II939_06770 [Bacteroidales bacterium]|nr:hypothetical protein [Bacteroidales bacterium]